MDRTINEKELLPELKKNKDLKWFVAMGGGEFVSAPWENISQVDWRKLLELRAFNERHEIKVIRGNLGERFQQRDTLIYAADPAVKSCTEKHYLDIDLKKGFEDKIVFVLAYATGGGQYGLPSPNAEKIEIENFYRPDGKGFYHPFDFRIVRFL